MKDVNILTSNGVNVKQSLELFGEMELYDETLNDFVDMAQEKIDNLNKYNAAGDMPNYAIAVHAMKSDARYLGFLEYGDLCYDSELKAKANNVAGVRENHPKVMEGVAKMLSVARQYLGRTDVPMAPQMQAMPQPQMVAGQPMPAMPQAVPVQPMPAQAAPMPNPQMMAQPQMQAMPNVGVGYSQPPMPQEAYYDVATGKMVYPQGEPMMQQQVATGAGFDAMMGQQMYPQMIGQPQMQAMPQQPAMYPNQAMPNGVQPQVPVQKQGTILVVDDSNLVANFVKKIFDARYDVVIASDGAKAIELCKDETFRSKIKACLLDLNMPNVDGYTVLEHFKQEGYFVRMPVAVISGVENIESIDRVNNYPIVDILAKPFNERDVQRVVEKCLATYF